MARRLFTRTASAVLLTAALAGCCPAGDGSGGVVPEPAPVTPAPLPATATPTPAAPRALPVYYVASTPAGYRLQREFHSVPTTDPASDSVREMLAHRAGIDPDYRSLWPFDTRLRSPVTVADGVITVDLTGAAATGPQPGPEAAAMTFQQLVFTVQAALRSADPVRVLVDGSPVARLMGTDTTKPVPRGDPYALRSLVQIDAPAHGATVGQQVEVTGEAAVFEATVHWTVIRGATSVRSGTASTTEGQRFAPYRFTVTLPPGEYVVRVTEDDPSDGAGRPVLSDDKTITVAQ